MNKLFLYDKDSVTTDTLRIMRTKKGYTCLPLTDDPEFFWSSISTLQKGDVFVLLSHGNKNGPLAVEGCYGDDIDLKMFSNVIKEKNLSLYLLSCHTGCDPCGKILTDNGVNFVAPLGLAVFQTVGSETINILSKEGDIYPGWAGPLCPGRGVTPLSLP
ncbi:hypothetical protein ABNH60_003431 [Salmonella enterica]